MSEYKSFATDAIHSGHHPNESDPSIVPPITMSSTYQLAEVGIDDIFTGPVIYSRLGNPTRDSLEKCIAKLENAKYGFAFASGMSAITACFQSFLQSGDHVVCSEDMYGSTTSYLQKLEVQFNVPVSPVDFKKVEDVTDAITEKTKLVYFEPITNPLIGVVDVPAVVKAVREKNKDALVIVDNTFLSPWNMRPIDYGVDIVLHSATKYINGHSDTICGLVSTNKIDLARKMKNAQLYLGGVPSPFDCFLVSRGIKTLDLRMERHAKNALKVAEWLEIHPCVEKVIYPGLKSHPQFELLKKISRTPSGMVTFTIKGGRSEAERFLKSLKIISHGVSLGGYESLAQHPFTTTHGAVSKEQKDRIGITENMIRVSIGLEAVHDIIEDIDYALKKATNNNKA